MFISPVAFSIFEFDIYWYALAYAFSALLIYWRAHVLLHSLNICVTLKREIDIEDFLFYTGLGMLVFGKIGFLFYDFQYMFLFARYGFSFFGGFVGIVLAILLYVYVYKLNFRVLLLYADMILAFIPIGIFLVRIANFINQECLGLQVEGLLWGVQFNNEDFYRHPTQLYEAFFEGFCLYFILYFIRIYFNAIEFFPGVISSMFLILYSIFRFVIEFYKCNVMRFNLSDILCGMNVLQVWLYEFFSPC
ncbi:MAG: prolipoprotein diacylglyceryl transferase [Pseudomonadota bacterium]